MKREELENNLGKIVEITLFDGDVVKGCLRKTQDQIFKNDPNLYIPKDRYFVTGDIESKICISSIFRASHVKKLN